MTTRAPEPHCKAISALRNLELKARTTDLDAARKTATRLATKQLGRQHQVDTYFHCNRGRLKLRQIDGLSAELVWYARADRRGPKTSDYRLVPIANPETLKSALSAALGVRGVVEKRREVFLYYNVRIHLDEVVGLGEFVEFEAVLGASGDETAGHARLELLTREFGIREDDLLPGSYADMLR